MGGLLGGLLAGGLLAAFFGGAFEGVQFMDILIMCIIAFVIFKLVRAMLGAGKLVLTSIANSPPLVAPHRNLSSQMLTNLRNSNSLPLTRQVALVSVLSQMFRIIHRFDNAAFVDGSREHYRLLQGAWNYNQLDTIEEYVSPSLFDDLKTNVPN